MKIGMVSDSLAHLGFHDMLDAAAELGAQGVEVNTGNRHQNRRFRAAADLRRPS
ncbi:MAG: hypothetical protein U1F68_20470 [Gammaproteobacteria bacterium]